jgi:3-deoxy-7-phosphoheptulonate synthase
MAPQTTPWTKSSWQNFTALQQPKWPNQEEYRKAVD